MKITLRKTQLAARYALWLALFFFISVPALAFDGLAAVARRIADRLCDVADFAVVRGRELRERLQ
ncbi:MAG: hypothetical protein FD139_730 [Methylocystaceae bacterium]|nr:MAG: hypothetical protein FD148_47 [Methylocystaceae bacterium]KAF0213980.1 MAG: hypothetical protein FD172_104 [Methylocystaceae bacterium]TXT46885.1 MAG: hypothetical protein FD139_730 [Methylocystaceae bacterium]